MTRDDDPATLDASEALARLRDGRLSAESLARGCLDRMQARDAEVRAWVHVDAAAVLAQARELDRQAFDRPASELGALHGLPIGIKDVMLTRDAPTQYNSPLYRGSHPQLDAACVATLRAAGAVIFGKTDTVEFAATGRRALTRNPHDTTRTPGASSSGSAAAVADRHVPLALGTQTAGSIVRPASFCGVWGFKPTWGLVSTHGVHPYAPTLDTVGWFARSSADLALMLDVFEPRAATAAPDAAPLRIGVCRTPMWARAEATTRDAFDAACDRLRGAGIVLAAIDLPAPFERLPELQRQVMRAEARASLWAESRVFPGRLEASLQAQVDNADGLTRAALCEAYDVAAACRPVWDALARGFDAVLAPSTVGEAPVGLAFTGDFVFNGLWTLLHVPVVNVPVARVPQALPLGLSLIGARFGDHRLLEVATALAPVLAR